LLCQLFRDQFRHPLDVSFDAGVPYASGVSIRICPITCPIQRSSVPQVSQRHSGSFPLQRAATGSWRSQRNRAALLGLCCDRRGLYSPSVVHLSLEGDRHTLAAKR
jgi:hypothetical protein